MRRMEARLTLSTCYSCSRPPMTGKLARAVLVLVGAATPGAGSTLGMVSHAAPAAAAPPPAAAPAAPPAAAAAAAPVPELPAIPGVSFVALFPQLGNTTCFDPSLPEHISLRCHRKPGLVTLGNATVAFLGFTMRLSMDDGRRWNTAIDIPHGGCAEPLNGVMVPDERTNTLHFLVSCLQSRAGVWQLSSTDLGSTWTFPKNITAMVALPPSSPGQRAQLGAMVPALGGGIQTRSGRLLAQFYGVFCWGRSSGVCKGFTGSPFRPPPQGHPESSVGISEVNFVLISDDHGRSWRSSSVFGATGAEGDLVQLPDGRLYYNYRSDGPMIDHCKDGGNQCDTGWGGNITRSCGNPSMAGRVAPHHCRVAMWSSDDGDSWHDDSGATSIYGTSLPDLPDPGCKGSVSWWHAGQSVLVSNVQNHGDPQIESPHRGNLTVSRSQDGGLTFPERVSIWPSGSSGYSSIKVISPGVAAVHFEAPWVIGAPTLLAIIDLHTVFRNTQRGRHHRLKQDDPESDGSDGHDVAPGLPPHLIGVSGFGWLVNGNTTFGISLEQLPHQVQLAYDAGIRIIRFDLSWNVTEPRPGVYDWSSYDAWLPVLWAGGMRVLLILDYANYYYNGFGSPSTPDGIAAFARWAGAAAEHYKGKQTVWEVYNEPINFWRAPTNTTPEPVPGNTPPRPGSGACLMYVGHGKTAPTSWDDPWCQQLFQDYAEMAIAAAVAVKQASPTDLVIGPAASERAWYFDSNQSLITEIFARGVLQHLDAVSVHAYTDGPGRLWDPEEVLPAYARLRMLIDKYKPKGKEIAIIDGEHGFYTACGSRENQGDGWPWKFATADSNQHQMCGGDLKQDVRERGVSDQAMQANYLARALLVNHIAGVAMTLWYDWRDPVDDTNSPGVAVFGLIHCLGNDTSAATAGSGDCEQTTPAVDRMGLTTWGHPKLSYVAMRTLHTQLGAMQYVGRLPSKSPDQFFLHFAPTAQQSAARTRGGGSWINEKVVVAWTRAIGIPEMGRVNVSGALGGETKGSWIATSVTGLSLPSVSAVVAGEGAYLEIVLTQSPIYLRSVG